MTSTTHAQITPFGQRVDELDWNRTVVALDETGVAAAGAILTSDECRHLSGLYDEPIHGSHNATPQARPGRHR